MKIKIERFTMNGRLTIIMNSNKKLIVINDKPVNYDVDRFAFKVCNMVSNWPETLEDDAILDGTSYSIVIKTVEDGTEKIREHKFSNKFPEDIFRLEMLIREIENS